MNLLNKLFSGLKKQRAITKKETTNIKSQIESSLWGAVSTIKVRVDNDSRRKTINILMPDITPHMSAGPLSILYFAKFLCENGYNVRLLIDTTKSVSDLRFILKQQSEDITLATDRFDVEALPLQGRPTVLINDQDMTVATLFNTAHTARKIQSFCRDKKFIYFIQDDERSFFPASSLGCIVEESYSFDFYPLFSTEILKNFFLQENVGNINGKGVTPISQGCPCNCYLPDFDVFCNRGKRRKRFVFYARPQTPRNCYEYAMHIIFRAAEMNLFGEDWDLYGMGFPNQEDIQLTECCQLHFIPNLSLHDYKNMLYTFDVGLSLMATPHPSMPPIDLALSGCVVVTNSYKNKTEAVMKGISKNIICAGLSVDEIIEALKNAIRRSENLSQRYANAKNASWPRSWNDVFTEEHLDWIRKMMRD